MRRRGGDWWQVMAQEMLDTYELNDGEYEFVSDMVNWYSYPSPNQEARLRNIYETKRRRR